MPRFEKNGVVVETAVPREAAELRANGFAEQKAKTKEVRAADAEAAKATEAPKSSK